MEQSHTQCQKHANVKYAVFLLKILRHYSNADFFLSSVGASLLYSYYKYFEQNRQTLPSKAKDNDSS